MRQRSLGSRSEEHCRGSIDGGHEPALQPIAARGHDVLVRGALAEGETQPVTRAGRRVLAGVDPRAGRRTEGLVAIAIAVAVAVAVAVAITVAIAIAVAVAITVPIAVPSADGVTGLSGVVGVPRLGFSGVRVPGR